MKVMFKKKIIDTANLMRVSGRDYYNSLGHSIADYAIEVDEDGKYYHIIKGYKDINSPNNDIEAIGSLDKLIDWIDEDESDGGRWRQDQELINHIEEALATVAD